MTSNHKPYNKKRIGLIVGAILVALIIFIPILQKEWAHRQEMQEQAFIENYPDPTIEILSSQEHQGDNMEYEFKVRVGYATAVWIEQKKMDQDPEENPIFTVTVPLDTPETEVSMLAMNEYKKYTIESIVIERNETEEEVRIRLEKEAEEERLANEAEQQRLAEEAERQAFLADQTAKESIIKEGCQAEWPEDFRMQKYCIERQTEALNTLNQGRPDDITEAQFDTIRTNCASEWANDFRMQEYCEEKQYEAIRELR